MKTRQVFRDVENSIAQAQILFFSYNYEYFRLIHLLQNTSRQRAELKLIIIKSFRISKTTREKVTLIKINSSVTIA